MIFTTDNTHSRCFFLGIFSKQVEIPKCLLPQKFPHYLEKRPDKTFQSSSVLGEIYDNAEGYRADNASTQGKPVTVQQ